MNIRREKKPRIKRIPTPNKERIKTIAITHAMYAAIQLILAAGCYLALRTNNHEPLRFFFYSLLICGFFACPAGSIKRIKRKITDREHANGVGSWIFQTALCISLIRLVFPLEDSDAWTKSLITAFTVSLLLLLLSSIRARRRRRRLTYG